MSSEFFKSTKRDGHPCNFWLISIRILSSNATSTQAALVLYLLADFVRILKHPCRIRCSSRFFFWSYCLLLHQNTEFFQYCEQILSVLLFLFLKILNKIGAELNKWMALKYFDVYQREDKPFSYWVGEIFAPSLDGTRKLRYQIYGSWGHQSI